MRWELSLFPTIFADLLYNLVGRTPGCCAEACGSHPEGLRTPEACGSHPEGLRIALRNSANPGTTPELSAKLLHSCNNKFAKDKTSTTLAAEYAPLSTPSILKPWSE